MVADRREIGIQRPRLRIAGGCAPHHPEQVLRLRQGGVRRDERQALAMTHSRRREDRRRSRKSDGVIKSLAIVQQRPSGAQRLDHAALHRKGADKREGCRARSAKLRLDLCIVTEFGKESVPEQAEDGRIRLVCCECFHGPAPDDQASSLPVDIRQDGFGGDDVLKSTIHDFSPSLRREMAMESGQRQS